MAGLFPGGRMCAAALLAIAACADTVPRDTEVHAVEAMVSPELRDGMMSDQAFAQVFSLRPNGGAHDVSESVTFSLDEPVVLFVDPDPLAVAYEVRISLGNARIASQLFAEPFAEGAYQVGGPISAETTVETDVVVSSLLSGSWCDDCSITWVRHFVSPAMAAALASAPRSYPVSVARYARGITAGIEAWSDRLKTGVRSRPKMLATQTRLDKAYHAYEARVAGGPADVVAAQTEVEHAFIAAHVDAGHDRALLAEAAQEVTELMIGWFARLDLRVVPSAIYEAERLRARAVQSWFASRLVDAGFDAMTVAGMNAEFSSLLRAATERGYEASYFTVQAWRAYAMGALVGFVDANAGSPAIVNLLMLLRNFDPAAKGAVNRIATEQATAQPRHAPIRESLDAYRVLLEKEVRDPVLRDIVYHTSIGGHGIPLVAPRPAVEASDL